MKNQPSKLGLSLLIFVAIGSMIGSGIFNAPKDLIHVANPQSIMLAWAIGGAGALTIALVFIYLAQAKPMLKSGVFAYAKDGFGDYMGFNAAWGYWSVGWLGNISYFILFFKTLNDLLGIHALSPWMCFAISSVILWIFYIVIAHGVREGAVLNLMVTVAKLLPIVLIIVWGIAMINPAIFHVPKWRITLASNGDPTSPAMQISEAMAIILWCFIGVEAASVLSGRAKSQKVVRQATIISIVAVLAMYMLITFVAMSTVPASELAASDTPLALVLDRTAIGQSGAVIVKLGIMISTMGASISWILLSVETLFAAAKNGVMPRILAKENRFGTPINALLLTQIFTQVFLVAILSPRMNESYLMAITIATSLVLVPYFLASMYAVKIFMKPKKDRRFTIRFLIALLATIYSLYVIYAVGIKYLFLAMLYYALGAMLFYWAKRERKEKIKKWEFLVMLALIVSAIVILLLISLHRIVI